MRKVRNDELAQLIYSQKNVDLIKTKSITNSAYYVLCTLKGNLMTLRSFAVLEEILHI